MSQHTLHASQEIADRLLVLDRERRAALVRQDYSEARNCRLEMNIVQALVEYREANETEKKPA